MEAATAGHTGTLDPLATGLLPVCFGEASKFSHVLLDAEKTYEARLRLGITTTTGDMDFLLHVLTPDLAGFSDFALKALLRMPGVRGTRSSFIMQAVKTDLAWAPIPQATKPRR